MKLNLVVVANEIANEVESQNILDNVLCASTHINPWAEVYRAYLDMIEDHNDAERWCTKYSENWGIAYTPCFREPMSFNEWFEEYMNTYGEYFVIAA